MEITIERHRWYRGQGQHHVFVKNESGQELKMRDPQSAIPNPNTQCCVFGFGRQQHPDADYRKYAISIYELVVDSNGAVINDDPGITDEARERQLTELFTKYGHQLKFVD
jgi:hypothetical protein